MKRKNVDEVFKVTTAKRQDRHIVIERIVSNPKTEAHIWKTTLTKKWGIDDCSLWKWGCVSKYSRPTDHAWRGSDAFILGNEKKVFAMLYKDGLLQLFPPTGNVEETFITTSMFIDQTNIDSWYSVSRIIWRYLDFEDWFWLGLTCKSSLSYFNGPESPFIPHWFKCKKYLDFERQLKCEALPAWNCMNMFAMRFVNEFVSKNERLALKLLKLHLRKYTSYVMIQGKFNGIKLLKCSPIEISFFEKRSSELHYATCTFTKAGLVDSFQKRRCFIKMDLLTKNLSELINSFVNF